MSLKRAWNITKETFVEFIDNKVLKLSAALPIILFSLYPPFSSLLYGVSDIFMAARP
ncbi:MAG: hypothetical protein WDO71_17395 [Bacteroidota bacterium]